MHTQTEAVWGKKHCSTQGRSRFWKLLFLQILRDGPTNFTAIMNFKHIFSGSSTSLRACLNFILWTKQGIVKTHAMRFLSNQFITGMFLLVGFSVLFHTSCRRPGIDLLDDAADFSLYFSTDTLRFDTTFTELGSATRILKVYNRAEKTIKIQKITLINGPGGQFRLNIDGIPANEIENVLIRPHDSLYVFAEVTVDPDQPLSVSPFVIEGKILFEHTGKTQEVLLEAWGQNANYIPHRFNQGGIALLSCNGTNNEISWDDPRPYVIYGILAIDSCTLHLPKGTKIYVHGGVAQTTDNNGNIIVYNDGFIYVLPDGRLRIEGTLEEPVIIQGDRLEPEFSEEPGQWNGIRLLSQDNSFEYAEIKNAGIGIFVDSAAQLNISHTKIYNTSGPGLAAQHASINASNCLLYNNAGNSLQISYGGSYRFDFCTFASYGVDAVALSLSNGICYDNLCSNYDIHPLFFTATNSIFAGSRQDEIELIDFTAGQDPFSWNIGFDHCSVRVNELLDPEKGGYPDFFTNICSSCISTDFDSPVFVSTDEDDYHLDSLSVVLDQGFFLPEVPDDLEGNIRDTNNPDLGCYERN